MRRFFAIAIVGLACIVFASTSRGGDKWKERWKAAWHNCCAITQRNNAWPEAFVPIDRAAARAPFVGCVVAGWRVQNTLADYHFDNDSGALKEAGVIKVKEIMTENPADFRTIFVLRAETAEITAARIASVQEAAAHYALPGAHPQVAQTFTTPRGSPAFYVVDIDRSFRESTPEPRIPERSSSTTSSTPTASGT